MESRNPAFSRRGAFGQQQAPGHVPTPQQLQGMYDAPSYAPPATRRMTVDDVVVRGFLMLGTLVATGAVAWVLNPPPIVAIVSLIVGLVCWAIMTFGHRVNAPLALGFAAAYGVSVGIVSHAYNQFYNGVVLQAVVGTALAFAAMLAVHALKIIRVTPKLVRYVVAAGFALLGLMLVNVLFQVFGVAGGIGIRDPGSPIAYVFSVVAILVGCFFLLLDFAAVEEGVAAGAPEKFAWYCAFGLTLSLVWIYLEMLRFLSYFSGRD
ncbi:MAG: putative YccA/Bax inhibitor family protein [Frankiales bacterium]|jgi:uncharacterized YccA/Bax inhibitor family protein|nr:putative YccA/Bax inhibitor family protein [Frankiales bacterium]